MRDPRGRIQFVHDRIVRELAGPLPPDDFLRLPLARDLVRDGLLIDFEAQEERITAPRMPWVSQPSEWCRAQLLDAALLTLDLAERVLPAGFELKDASAWNVIFDGAMPMFCDHLSFERLQRREWRALGQFARHFILPLAVAGIRGLPIDAQFRMSRDGITPQLARSLCGLRLYLTRAAPLALGIDRNSTAAPHAPKEPGPGNRPALHQNLLRYCRFALPQRQKIQDQYRKPVSGWSKYVEERSHYTAQALDVKQERLQDWISTLKPRWALDLGANTGEFSLIAARAGARVIAIDSDHDCIERLYLAARAQPELARKIHVAVAQLDDITAGRGWSGREIPGLVERLAGHCDLVMMLGLLHHLMIACAIPVAAIAQLAADLNTDALLLETIPERDPMFRVLAEQYGRTGDAEASCGLAAQRAAFERHFQVVERSPLPGSERELLLLRKKLV